MLRIPDRSRVWPSAMIRRAGLVSLSILYVLFGAFERYTRHDEGSAPGAAKYLERATEQRDPLLHARDADPLSGTASTDHLDFAEPFSAVSHPKTHLLPQATDAQTHARSIRVFARVRQRLLGYTVERGLERGRKPLVAELLIVGDYPPFRPQGLYLQAEGRRQVEVVERRRPETRDHPPHLFDRLLDQGQIPRQALPAPYGVWRISFCEGLQVLLDGDDHLGDP